MKSIIKKLGKTSITVEKDYHSSNKEYNKLTIVEEQGAFKTYLSRKPVPVGIELTNREYWIPFSGVLESIVFDYLKFKKDYASGKNLEDNAIITRHIRDRNVTGNKIADDAITTEKIVDDSIIISKLSTDIQLLISNLSKTSTFAGIATPTTNPGTPDGPVFYFANSAGIYTNFNNIKVLKGENIILKWNDNIWTKNVFKPNTDFDSIFDANGKSLTEFESGIVYDVSAHNDDIIFESLQALLNSSNLNILIPKSVRHGGMSIRFVQSPANKYVQWRLVSKDWNTDVNNWIAENEDFRNSVMEEVNTAVASIKPIEITGDVTNAPDEEDLTSINVGGTDVLKFKDKPYTPLTYSGMGRKILRKNIVDGINTLTQSMMQDTNTIYVIQYDFDLQGQTISIPSNCVLHFVGGVISNGIIFGNNTTINGAEYGAFDGVILSGSFTNIESNLSWWGCVPFNANNQYDNSSKISNAFQSSISRIGVSTSYGVSKPIDMKTKHVVGISDEPGFRFCGFYANSDFSPVSVTLPRDGKTYEVNGLFYHYYDEHPSIENITIDLGYHAKYAIEHIAGYSNIEISNVSIFNALVAGILQYGCEKMTWNTLYVSNCRYGAIISTNKFNEDNPFSFGELIGMCNLVVLEHCRFLGGNYGLICNGGSNYKLDSCETAYNSLFGLILLNSGYLLLNYYSEGDCLSNFWINNNGIKSYPNSDGGTTEVVGEWDKGKTHPYLVENNIDGILCETGEILESPPYMRSVIYASRADINLVSPFLSIKPRSYNTSDIVVSTRELPTERNASGVDALIIAIDGSIILRNIKAYSLYNDIGTMAFTDIVMKARDHGGYSSANNTMVSCDGGYQVRLWYDYFNNRFTNFNNCRLSPLVNSSKNVNHLLIDIKPSNLAYEDLNSDQDSWLYGTSVFTPYKHHSLRGYVKNVPVYKRDTSRNNYSSLNFTKEQFLSKFGDRMQVKCKFVAYIPKDVTSRVRLIMYFANSSYSMLAGQIATDESSSTLIKAGYYELTTIVPVRPKESLFNDWAATIFYIDVFNEPTIDVYVSDIYFYDIGDNSELCNNSNPVLVSGATDIRPYLPFIGQSYFDTTLGKSIIWTGSKWVDTTGADV